MNDLYTGSLWEELAESLRDEFQEYGGILTLLKEQQDALIQRNHELLSEKNALIARQMEDASGFRERREAITDTLIQSLNLDPDMTIKELIRHAPAMVIPMFEALIDGAEGMIKKIQNKLRQNRLLVSRSSEITDQVLEALRPVSVSKTYTMRGKSYIKHGIQGDRVNFSA